MPACWPEAPRDEDRPPYDGSVYRALLQQLTEPRTVGEVAQALGWDYRKAERWIYHLRASQKIRPIRWILTPANRRAQQYQVDAPAMSPSGSGVAPHLNR